MSFDGAGKQWKCAKGRPVNFHKVSAIVRDIGEPCLHQSPIKVVTALNKMLKPDKWQATFDNEGKIYGFHRVLKLIILGGVDPSIRAEVWEFLLGCYSLSSTAEYRRQLRSARRERYRDIVKQCQMMHPSVGTGSLAYVGSNVMDMRRNSKEDVRRCEKAQSGQNLAATIDKIEDDSVLNGTFVDRSDTNQEKSCNDSSDLLSVRVTVGGAYDSSDLQPCDPCNNNSSDAYGTHESISSAEPYLDFPDLLVTDLFEDSIKDTDVVKLKKEKCSAHSNLRRKDERMHSFRINNNSDLVAESNIFPSNEVSLYTNVRSELTQCDLHGSLSESHNLEHKEEILNGLRISDAPVTAPKFATTSQGGIASEDRVSEWLWMLNRIVVDVVRTDSHLEFYEDAKNLARMSDILAVYAWVDPSTGYCQGMSDLLSPFLVLFEDNADAFWCFEMLLRRMRDNFKMEGPTGVMKQLQALWHILELTDKAMFSHLSHIGAESLHFAFRMLLVLFRRELSFNEALCMWEMIWAADFDVSLTCFLSENCPEALVIHLPMKTEIESAEESIGVNSVGSKDSFASKHDALGCFVADSIGIRSTSTKPFCGLAKTLWERNDHFKIRTLLSSTRNGDDELPVFCVAAILVTNRQKIVRETHSIDDLIKVFNDNILKIRVKRCVHTALKLRKKYFYKLIRSKSSAAQGGS